MSKETNELLNLFIAMTSNDPESIQKASLKFSDLSTKPNYALNLLYITINNDVEMILRFSAAIQLKNIIDKQWQRCSTFPDSDRQIIRNQILNCSVILENKTSKLYSVLADIIGRISRSDWNQKWPNLFNDLFLNDSWIIIYRVCQIQSTRRLSQGITLFKELASVMSSQIIIKWQTFLNNFELKYNNQSNDSSLLYDFINITYQLRTMCLFIRNTHLILSEDVEFCNIISSMSFAICSYFPNFLKFYHNSVSISNDQTKIYFYKFLKSMVWFLLSYQSKVRSKSSPLTKEIENFTVNAIFHSNYLVKSEKLTLLLLNLLLNTLNHDDKINTRNNLFDLQILNCIQSKFLTQLDDDVESFNNDPETILECKLQKEDSIILYKIDDVVDELLVLFIRCVFQKNLNGIMELVQMGFNSINSMSMSDLEAFLHLMGIIIKSCYYHDNCISKKCETLCNCLMIVDNVTNILMNFKETKVPNAWENFVIKRCVWLLSKWVADDPNLELLSMERIIAAAQWCFKIVQSSFDLIVKIEVVLFIEHIIDVFDKMPSDFVDTPVMHEVFLNPSISTVVSLLNITTSSDTHARFIEILIKLLHATNMWNNIDLVKTCANSIYNLWNGFKWPSKETVILRDRLLECLCTIVKSCDPVVIQPILATLTIFINDSLQLMIKPEDKTNSSSSSDNCTVLLDNTLQLWHDIIYNCEISFEGLDNIYSLIIFFDALGIELDRNETTLLLEIIQAHFLLKVIGSVNREAFSSLTHSTWNYIMKQAWDPKHEEDLCVMRIQLFDLWLLGSQQLSYGVSVDSLMQINSYCSFLCERTKELFMTTNEEPSSDQYVCIVNSTLTVLARICLFDRSMLKSMLFFLSNGEAENQHLVIGLLNRWLLRIDNQASSSIQQLFVLACIQWLPVCFEIDPTILSSKLETLINSCIQICSSVPSESIEEKTQLAKSTPIPAERHLRLAYIVWNPLTNYSSEIRKLVTTLLAGLNSSVGLDNFQTMLSGLDPTVQRQFLQLCSTSN